MLAVMKRDTVRTRLGFIGMGSMARHHLDVILERGDTQVAAICEPSTPAYDTAAAEFRRRRLPVPPNEPDWRRFIERFASRLDAVFIVTPHVLHFSQATACLEAGLDVVLEKPMVMTADEAKALIATRDRTGRLVVVAFQGSLSPHVREASRLLRSGELGSVLNINAVAWQDWAARTAGSWRQDPHASGGGFLFDTGAHMLNTVSDIAGEPFSQVAAWLEDDGHPVEIRAVVMARLASGALVTMNACGSAIPSCQSDIRVFTTKAILRTGIWGEGLELQRAGTDRMQRVRPRAAGGVWEQFLKVRVGQLPNPSPPEVGLRMAQLWDAIRDSAARAGAVITNPTSSPFDEPPLPRDELGAPAPRFAPRLGFEPTG